MSGIIKEHDSNGKLIYSKAFDGSESWCERDANGNFIYTKICHLGSVIFEEWWKYDDQSRCVHYKNSKGNEEWWDYDVSGKLVFYKKEMRYA